MMMKKNILAGSILALFLLLLVISANADGKKDKRKIDYLGVAAIMLRDGNYEKAKAALDNINPDDGDLDVKRYHTLSGLVALRLNNGDEAISHFKKAIESGQAEGIINVYLAQAYFAKNAFQEAIDIIKTIKAMTQYPAMFSLLAECQWKLNKRIEAYNTLVRAVELLPGQVSFIRQQIYYLLEMNLTQEASKKSMLFLERMKNEASAFVTVGEALRRSGNPDLAVEILEKGRLLYHTNEQIYLALAQAYLDKQYLIAAGTLIERAAVYNNRLHFEAAEIFRRAKSWQKALFLNSLVRDEKQKTLQRFNILMSMERYELSVALEQRLKRNGHLDNDTTRYAFAYALFSTDQFDRAIRYLNKIESSQVFYHATQLRKAIEKVRNADENI